MVDNYTDDLTPDSWYQCRFVVYRDVGDTMSVPGYLRKDEIPPSHYQYLWTYKAQSKTTQN